MSTEEDPTNCHLGMLTSYGAKGSTDMLDFRESSASAKNWAGLGPGVVRNDWTKAEGGKRKIHRRRVGNLSCAVTNNIWTHRC